MNEKNSQDSHRVSIDQEREDFNKIYSQRFLHMKSILLNDDRVEEYFYNNPWRYSFSRQYAFESIIDRFHALVDKRQRNTPVRVLEIGCGNGWFSINANKDNTYKFTSIDISPEATAIAIKYAEKAGVTNNEYLTSDFESLHVAHRYDMVVCINSLHHFVDLDLLCTKVNEHMTDEGRLFICDVCPDEFGVENAGYVLTIENLLSAANAFYKNSTENSQERLLNILNEWRNETNDSKQSLHDHFHSTKDILCVLRKSFVEQSYAGYGGILSRILGGIRGDQCESIGRQLIKLEEVLLINKLIKPYSYCFVGSKR
jgi:2-polyprenyl-3-methyl-5-hydroxy-6-metoxy-1,4-benzoquinol methylase